MPSVVVSLDVRSCTELGLSVTAWCSVCSYGVTLANQPTGLKLTDMFLRLRCRRCGAPAGSLTVDHRLKGGGKSAEVLRLERESPAT